jgi:hypothetical protein
MSVEPYASIASPSNTLQAQTLQKQMLHCKGLEPRALRLNQLTYSGLSTKGNIIKTCIQQILSSSNTIATKYLPQQGPSTIWHHQNAISYNALNIIGTIAAINNTYKYIRKDHLWSNTTDWTSHCNVLRCVHLPNWQKNIFQVLQRCLPVHGNPGRVMAILNQIFQYCKIK